MMSQPIKAQMGKSDGFFTNNESGYSNRDGDAFPVSGSITNDSFGAPLGNGLLIMVAAGLCYALKIKIYEKNEFDDFDNGIVAWFGAMQKKSRRDDILQQQSC